MNKLILFLLFFSIFSSNIAYSKSLYVDPQVLKYQEYNPDGKKYEFVRSYINGLSYIYKNNIQNEANNELSFEYLENASNLIKLRDNLVMNNINLRIARNFVKKYNTSENGLILKVTDAFVKLCDGLIEINEKNKVFYNSLYEKSLESSSHWLDRKEIVDWQQSVNTQRKELLMSLLESSMLVTKVLVSSETDGYGELSYLALTNNQRYNLLMLLDGFQGEEYQGELREGQSFLGGSIAVIREVLENNNYTVLDR